MKSLLEQVQELVPLAAAATEGPWRHPFASAIVVTGSEGAGATVVADVDMSNTRSFDDASFIAAARNLNFAALHAALATTHAPVAAPATGVVGEAESALFALLQAAPQHDYYSRGRAAGIAEALTLVRNAALATPAAPSPGALATTGEAAAGWKRHHYPEEEMPEQLGMYAVGVNGRTTAMEWHGSGFINALGRAAHPEFFFSEPLPVAPQTQSTLEGIISQKAAIYNPAAPVMPAGPATHA